MVAPATRRRKSRDSSAAQLPGTGGNDYPDPWMRRSTRRLLLMLASIPVLLLIVAWVYALGMEHLEGTPRTLGSSLEWAAETVTTTGYGQDAEWRHPAMQVFVIIVQFSGVFLTFLVFPVFLIPFIEERFEGRLPTVLPKLKGYILVYRWGPTVAALVEQLEHDGVPVVILEEDLTIARRLHDRGRNVVYGTLEEDEEIVGRLRGVRGIVANGPDAENAIITLTARQRGFEGPIVALVENPNRRAPMQRAGATAVFTPRHALAAAVAAKASVKISPRVSGVQSLGKALEIAEVRVARGCALAGKSLAEIQVRKRTGATVIGQWIGGELSAEPMINRALEVGTILVVAGNQGSIDALSELASPVARTGHFVVVGFEETGRKVAQFLIDAGEEVRVVHTEAADGVGFVGDVLDPSLLIEAGVRDAQSVVLAMESDSETVFAAAVVRDLAPDATIVGSVDRLDNVARTHRAGADFVLSIGQVAGQLLAFQLLGEEAVSLQPQIKLVKTVAGSLAGKKLLSTRVRERTGCSIVAVERGEGVIVGFDAEFVLDVEDTVYISGSPATVTRYFEVFPDTRAPKR